MANMFFCWEQAATKSTTCSFSGQPRLSSEAPGSELGLHQFRVFVRIVDRSHHPPSLHFSPPAPPPPTPPPQSLNSRCRRPCPPCSCSNPEPLLRAPPPNHPQNFNSRCRRPSVSALLLLLLQHTSLNRSSRCRRPCPPSSSCSYTCWSEPGHAYHLLWVLSF